MAGTVKKLQFSEGTNVGAPTDLSLATSTSVLEAFVDDAAYVVAEGAAGDGSTYINTTDKTLKTYVSSAWRGMLPKQDPTDATKEVNFNFASQGTGRKTIIGFKATSADKTVYMPDANTNLVGDDTTNDLSNKTLVTPIFKGASATLFTPGNFAFLPDIGANFLDIGGATTNVRIPGNLEVQGTTSYLNTTNTDIKDKNITLNKGGNDASSEGAGFTVERTGTNGSVIYGVAYASKFAFGALGSEAEGVTVTHIQTIENKRMRLDTTPAVDDTTSPRFVSPSNTLANLQAISSGNQQLGAEYFASDVKKKYFWDGAALRPLGSGSGSGAGTVNFFENTDFEATTDGVSAYDDTSAIPVDGTGGSPTVTFSRNQTTPLNGTADLKLTKGASNCQGQGWAFTAPVPKGYQYAQTEQVSFLWDSLSDSDYATGDYKVYIYDVTNSAFITPRISDLPANFRGKFSTYFDARNGASYRVLIHVASTNAAAIDVFVDDFVIGPIASAPMGITKGKLTPYTPIFSSSAVGSEQFYFAEDGEHLIIQGYGIWNGAGGTFSCTLPTGYTILTSVYNFGSAHPLGEASVFQSPYVIPAFPQWIDSTHLGLYSAYNVTSFSASGLNYTSQANLNSGDQFGFTARVRCVELVGKGILPMTVPEIETVYNSGTWDADDSTSFAYGPQGQAMTGALTSSRIKRVRFQTPIQSTDNIVVQGSSDGVTWFDMNGCKLNGIVVTPSPDGAGFSNGVAIDSVVGVPTDVDVEFGRYMKIANDDSPLFDWPSTNAYWRVVKIARGLSIGVEPVTSTHSGVIPALETLSRISVRESNSSGSTDTSIRRFLTTVENLGTSITYAESAANGSTFTINEEGLYSITYTDLFNATASVGLSRNSTQLGSSIGAINDDDMLIMSTTSGGSYAENVAGVFYLYVGDVIRPHHDGSSDATGGDGHRSRFIIQKIS